MYELMYKAALVFHIATAAMALLVFWLPIIEKKGSPWHRKSGQWFVWGMTVVSISGIIMSSLIYIDPLAVRDPSGTFSLEQANARVERDRGFSAFLFMLSFLVLTSVRHSILVLEAKANRTLLKTPVHLGCMFILFLSAIYVGMNGLARHNVLFQIFSVLSFVTVIGLLRYIYKAQLKKSEWIIEHLTSVFGAGIGAYTAFFVFGGNQLINAMLPGVNNVIFWVAPGVIGITLTRFFAVKYRKRFNVA